MALLAYLLPGHEAVRLNIAYLVASQTKRRNGATWPERDYASTGFPNLFYLG